MDTILIGFSYVVTTFGYVIEWALAGFLLISGLVMIGTLGVKAAEKIRR